MRMWLYSVIVAVLATVVAVNSEKPVLTSQVTIIPRFEKAKVCFRTSDMVQVSEDSSSGSSSSSGEYQGGQRGKNVNSGSWSEGRGRGPKGLIAIASGGSGDDNFQGGRIEEGSYRGNNERHRESHENWNSEGEQKGGQSEWSSYSPQRQDQRTNHGSHSEREGRYESREDYSGKRPGSNGPQNSGGRPRDFSNDKHSYSFENNRYPGSSSYSSASSESSYGGYQRPGDFPHGYPSSRYPSYPGNPEQYIPGFPNYQSPNWNYGYESQYRDRLPHGQPNPWQGGASNGWHSEAGGSGQFGPWPSSPHSSTSVSQSTQINNNGNPWIPGYPASSGGYPGSYAGFQSPGFGQFQGSSFVPGKLGEHSSSYGANGGLDSRGPIQFPTSYSSSSISQSTNQHPNGHPGFNTPVGPGHPFGPNGGWTSQSSNSYAGSTVIQPSGQTFNGYSSHQSPIDVRNPSGGFSGIGGGNGINIQSGALPGFDIHGGYTGNKGFQQPLSIQTIVNQLLNKEGGALSNGQLSSGQYQTIVNQLQNILGGSSGGSQGNGGKGNTWSAWGSSEGDTSGFGNVGKNQYKNILRELFSQIGQGGNGGRGTAGGFFGGHFELTNQGNLKWVVDTVESLQNSNRNERKAIVDLSKICGNPVC